jgi:Protein of unknown function (DUF2795)
VKQLLAQDERGKENVMSNKKREFPEWPAAEEGSGIHTEGGPDAIEAGAWGSYEPYMADLELYLGDLDFPVDRDELIDHVRDQGAPEVIIVTLAQLPAQQFTSAADISMALEGVQ